MRSGGAGAGTRTNAGCGALDRAPLYRMRRTDTTMDRAAERLAAGDPHGTVVVADFQSAGRGRGENRDWVAPPGSSLLCTVVLRTEATAHLHSGGLELGMLPLVAGLAAGEAVEKLYGERIQLKWPNDLMLRERKLGGILCRFRDGAVLVGIGINCNQRWFPNGLRRRAIALREVCGGPVARTALLCRVLERLQFHTGDQAPSAAEQLAAVNRRLFRRGGRVSFHTPDDGTISGRLVGIDEHGMLVLEVPQRGRCRYLSGEIRS